MSRKCEHGMMPWECGYCYDKKSDDIQAEREALIKRARERREYFQATKNFSSVGFYDDLIKHIEKYNEV